MSPHQIVAILVRLFAIWIGVNALRFIAVFYLEGVKQGVPYILPVILAAVISVTIVLVLWHFPQTIAKGLLKSSDAEVMPPASQDIWLAMGAGLIGLALLASALPGLISDLIIELSSDRDIRSSTVRTWFLYYGTQSLIAVWLIFGARGFRKIFWWARSTGRY